MFSPSTEAAINAPGQTIIHHDWKMTVFPSLIILPQLGSGIGMPTARKLSDASEMTAVAKMKETCTSTVGMTFGMIFSQLVRDYGDKEAKVVMNTVGNIFSGQVVGETAKTLSERFGKVLQKRQSISINRQDVSTSINTQMDALIPPSKISGLTQGMFVGSVSDNFNERIEQKIFHCEIVVDAEKVKREEKAYKKIPVITDFTDEDGNDHMKETVQANYRRIKEEVKQIVQEELERIANDDNLKHLLQQK